MRLETPHRKRDHSLPGIGQFGSRETGRSGCCALRNSSGTEDISQRGQLASAADVQRPIPREGSR